MFVSCPFSISHHSQLGSKDKLVQVTRVCHKEIINLDETFLQCMHVSKHHMGEHWWLIPVILTTWEAEIGRIMVQGQPRQIEHETPFPK
jgi:hypothetical protein